VIKWTIFGGSIALKIVNQVMDLRNTLNDLYTERAKLDKVISFLEGLAEATPRPLETGRRGRRFMSSQERQIVSERMRKYWAGRRTIKEQAKMAASAA
jgi:hypothetical protein